MTDTIKAFIDEDNNRVEELIKENPIHLPIAKIAEFLQIDVATARAVVECNCFGLAWKKQGKLNKAYCIPTAQFVRWYLLMRE